MELRKLLVPHDDSQQARAALQVAMGIAERFDAEVHLLRVLHLPNFAHPIPNQEPSARLPQSDGRLRRRAERSLGELARKLDGPVRVRFHVAEYADVVEGVVEIARELPADMIVMGTRGRDGLAHFLLGSVTERMVRRAPCPLLSVNARGRLAGGAAAD